MSDAKSNPRIVADNIIAEYGLDGFRELIKMFCDAESGAKIGHAFSVSRQRVHQWKRALGYEETTYVLHQSVAGLLPKRNRGTQRTAV